MNTVKHFKDAGLTFVKGDECRDEDGMSFNNDWITFVNGNDDDYDDDEMIEFAWRENTGKAPEFKGEIEVKLQCGTVDVFTSWAVNWLLDGSEGEIAKWRPLLTQSEPQQEKPIYTEEVKQGGGIPPIDSDFMACGLQWTCVATHTDGGVIGEDANANLRHFACEECEPLKSQRDIEIDLIKKVALIIAGGILSAASERDIEEIHKMGYRVTKVEE